MKNKILLFLVAITFGLKSQDIVFTSDYDKSDLQDAFTLLGVNNFKYKMPEDFKGFYFDLIIREYYEEKKLAG